MGVAAAPATAFDHNLATPFFFSPFQVRLINNNIWLGRVYTTDILRFQKFTGAGKGRKNWK